MMTTDAVEAAAYWLVTFLDGGGEITSGGGRWGLYWSVDPRMPHYDWLTATLAGAVEAIIRDVYSDGPVAEEVRAIVRAKVRHLIGGRRAGAAHVLEPEHDHGSATGAAGAFDGNVDACGLPLAEPRSLRA